MTNLQFYCGHSLCAGTPYQSCSVVFLAIKHIHVLSVVYGYVSRIRFVVPKVSLRDVRI